MRYSERIKKDQRGITHHLFMLVLGILVVGVIGFAGYRVYSKTRLSAKAESTAPVNGDIITSSKSYSHDGKIKTLNNVFNKAVTPQGTPIINVDSTANDNRFIVAMDNSMPVTPR